jgi:hypothetical protein
MSDKKCDTQIQALTNCSIPQKKKKKKKKKDQRLRIKGVQEGKCVWVNRWVGRYTDVHRQLRKISQRR